MLKSLAKTILPPSGFDYLRRYRREWKDRAFRSQSFTTITCGDYQIRAPKGHLLPEFQKTQPYRDLCVGVAAKYVTEKYPNATVVDIGANIGDTAAIVLTYARPRKLLLIEGSDYYFDILERNVAPMPGAGDIVCRKVLLSSDDQGAAGAFFHRTGTASFEESSNGHRTPTERLADVADSSTRFVKTDTDGFDFRILLGSIDWLAQVHPAVLFEDQIRNEHDLAAANWLCVRLGGIGYRSFIVWTDTGGFLLSTSSLETLTDLNRWLLKEPRMNNLDILALHADDEDVFGKICEWYRTH